MYFRVVKMAHADETRALLHVSHPMWLFLAFYRCKNITKKRISVFINQNLLVFSDK